MIRLSKQLAHTCHQQVLLISMTKLRIPYKLLLLELVKLMNMLRIKLVLNHQIRMKEADR